VFVSTLCASVGIVDTRAVIERAVPPRREADYRDDLDGDYENMV
jgi:hypothetical protein